MAAIFDTENNEQANPLDNFVPTFNNMEGSGVGVCYAEVYITTSFCLQSIMLPKYQLHSLLILSHLHSNDFSCNVLLVIEGMMHIWEHYDNN